MTDVKRALLALSVLASPLTTQAICALQIERGDTAGYWENHSVVLGELLSTSKKDDGYNVVEVRPLGTIAGKFDSGSSKALKLKAFVAPDVSAIEELPKQNSVVLVVVLDPAQQDTNEPGYYVPSAFESYMPAPFAGICALDGLSDPRIERTIAAVRIAEKKSREGHMVKQRATTTESKPKDFWRSQVVLYAEVKKVDNGVTQTAARIVTIAPKIAISGQFDPAISDELILKISDDALSRQPTAEAGSRIVIVLSREQDHFVASKDGQDLIPGANGSFRTVVDFSGPVVWEATKRVQNRRKREQDKQR